MVSSDFDLIQTSFLGLTSNSMKSKCTLSYIYYKYTIRSIIVFPADFDLIYKLVFSDNVKMHEAMMTNVMSGDWWRADAGNLVR